MGNSRSNNFDLSPSAYDDLYYYDYDYSDEDSYCHLDYRDDTAAYEDYIEDCYDYD